MKTSKEKMMLEAFINKFDGEHRIERECKFHPTRKWRFDWAIDDRDDIPVRNPDGSTGKIVLYKSNNGRIAIEYEGGVFTGGGHTRGVIYSGNAEKYNEAALMGWTVLRFTAPMIRSGLHEDQINRALGITK